MLDLKSKIEEKILGYYFLNNKAKKYLNELARILEVDPGNLDRKLKELKSEGLLNSEFSGNQRYYSLNSRYPFLKELKKIYGQKYGLEEIFRKNLEKLSGLKEAYIFGSYAKNEFKEESDIDLLLVGSHSSLEAQRLIADLQKKLQREINIVDLTEKELGERKKKKDEFLKNIFKGKILRIYPVK